MAPLPHTDDPFAPIRLRRFDAVTMALHWATALLILAMFASAWSLKVAADGEQAKHLLTTHRSLGVTVWIATCCRLGWRRWFATRPPLPETTSKLQRLAAELNERGLYALLLLQPLTGLAQSMVRGRSFQLFFFEVPKLVARNKATTALFHQLHGLAAWVLLALIGLHATAALVHRYVLGDQVLQSMLPARAHEPRSHQENLGGRE